jgi:hypothetical protein
LTLRRRLIAVQVGLVAVGLTAFSVLSYQLYRHSSYQQIDNQLQSVAPLLSQTLHPAGQGYGPPPGGGVSGPPQSASHNLPPGSYAELLTPTGQLVSEPIRVPCYSSASCPVPKLPCPPERAGLARRADLHRLVDRRPDQLPGPRPGRGRRPELPARLPAGG